MERKDFLRNSLGFLGIGAIAVRCGKTGDSPATTTDSTSTSTGGSSSGECVLTGSETAGPYPSKTPSSLDRSDITDVQAGVPLTLPSKTKTIAVLR